MFAFGPIRPARRASLTPMIDVVFLLLVFFMLAARFGTDFALPLQTAGSGAAYSGPPRLVEIASDGVTLNGVPVGDLAVALAPLMSAPDDVVVLRARGDATLQDLVRTLDALRGAGLTQLVVVE
ncbi:ExbD/TolR family protein [Pseudosulfitobacter koreensis]|uniref:Biopolymer transporter ExbD n=1 Tax=Pseudosulfitobacter koreensis TaxID=2968472 RepID=A0ABT1YY01_9RHOB|nr:biopolymer transporter ExbD [Pseudosulfitobacter koreense]MCR8825761.1 biopolymer transporter ExbD [Pseudosulfitobacter koreense]